MKTFTKKPQFRAGHRDSHLQFQLLGRWRKEGGSRQKVSEIPTLTNKPGVRVDACNPSYNGGIGKRITV
jgi:hypothetical protein